LLSGGLIEYAIDPRSRAYDPNPQDGCAVRISVKGYQSVHVTLKENAVIVLKRIGEQEGLTVSSTALDAPKDARKAYEQGSAALADGKAMDSRVVGENISVSVGDMSFPNRTFGGESFDESRIVAVGHKADFLTLRLVGIREA